MMGYSRQAAWYCAWALALSGCFSASPPPPGAASTAEASATGNPATGTATAESTADQPRGPLDDCLRHVPPTFAAALIAHPQRMLAAPIARALPIDELAAQMQGYFGFRPHDIERAILFVEIAPLGAAPAQSATPALPVLWLSFARPIDVVAIAEQQLPDAEAIHVVGRPCVKSGLLNFDGEPGAIYLHDPKTIAIGPIVTLERMFRTSDAHAAVAPGKAASSSKPTGSSPLAEQLRSIDLAHDVVVTAVAAPLAELLAEALPEWNAALPEAGQPYLAAIEKTKTLTIAVDLISEHIVTIELVAADPQQAAELADLTKRGIVELKQLIPEVRTMFFAEGQPYAKIGTLWTREAETTLAALEPQIQGDQVRIAVPTPQSLQHVPELLAEIEAAVKAEAEKLRELDNLKRVATAMSNYALANQSFPPAASQSADGKPLLSWRVHLLPFLAEAGLYQQFKLDEPWDSPHNKPLIEQMPLVYAWKWDATPGNTSLQLVTGEAAAFHAGRSLSLADIRDGLSNTILLTVTGPDRAVPWTQPDDIPFDPAAGPAALGAMPGDELFIVTFDGNAWRIKKSLVTNDLWKALVTPGGEERIDTTIFGR